MPRKIRRLLPGTRAQQMAVAATAALGFLLFLLVDLTPRIEGDFFFSNDDLQLQQSVRIADEFGSAEQVFIAVRSENLQSRRYLQGVLALTHDLSRIEGVTDANSITHGPEDPREIARRDPGDVFEDLAESPFWSRLLLAPDGSSTFVVLRLSGRDKEPTVRAIDQALDRHRRPGFELDASGVPYVSEHIRQRLARELWRFSVVAFVVFALVVGVVFRSAAIVMGTMVAALGACFATFLVRALAGMRTDILTPNLWTIAFVLTLSHVVYLAAEWRRAAQSAGRGSSAVQDAIRLVGPASAWSLVANLLGFGSLLFVTAEPLRQFGISGAIAAVLAMVCAYTLFPPFLRSVDPGRAPTTADLSAGRFFTSRHARLAGLVIIGVALVGPLAWRVNTDPSLPTYFPNGDRLRSGLEAIDRSSGSSPLDLVVEDSHGRRLDDGKLFERLRALERRLERHPDVGSVLSIAALMAETERPWYSFLVSWETRVDGLDSPRHDRVGRTFISDDRRRGRFILRMHELSRDRPRADVVDEIETIVRDHGFRPALVAGLYPLQGDLSTLVEGSVVQGLGGLIGLFAAIAFVVTRSAWTTLAMTICLLVPPFALFGMVGLLRMPVDIISAPAANVALPMGIDEMIHLGYAVRRSGRPAHAWTTWAEALAKLWWPILASMLIVASGFSLFLLSSFPPTQRLGLLVCVGAVLTDLAVLIALPALASRRDRGRVARRALFTAR